MALVDELRRKISCGEFEFSRHAVDQSIRRSISLSEMLQAISRGDIIEEYPDDKYGPSCLIYGLTDQGRPLHFQLSYPSHPLIKVITLYEPDPDRWIDFRVRKT